VWREAKGWADVVALIMMIRIMTRKYEYLNEQIDLTAVEIILAHSRTRN